MTEIDVIEPTVAEAKARFFHELEMEQRNAGRSLFWDHLHARHEGDQYRITATLVPLPEGEE